MIRFFHLSLLCAALAPLPAQTQGWQNLGHGLAGSTGVASLSASAPQIGMPLDLSLRSAPPSSLAYFVIGLARSDFRIPGGGTLVPTIHAALPAMTGRAGTASAQLWIPLDPGFEGAPIFIQCVVFDPPSITGIALTPALGWSINGAPQMFGPVQQVSQIGLELTGIEADDIDGDGHADFALGAVSLDQVRSEYGDGNGAFAGTQTWNIGDGPTDIALGDFDGDGMVDVIATNHWEDGVRIRYGGSNLTIFYSTGVRPWRVRTGDLNGDGLDDFVTTNYGNDNITVRLKLQNGGFASATYGAGTGNHDIQLGDVDGDGDLDIVYPQGLHAQAVIKVRLNDGTGSFGGANAFGTGSVQGEYLHSVAVGDLNGDGDLDIVATRNSHSMVRLLGNGDGTFGQAVSAGTKANPWRVYMSDLNLDGKQDLVLAHRGEGVTVYLGQGNGNVSGPHQFKTNVTSDVSDLAVADFNEDGRPDLVFTGSGGAYVRFGQ